MIIPSPLNIILRKHIKSGPVKTGPTVVADTPLNVVKIELRIYLTVLKKMSILM